MTGEIADGPEDLPNMAVVSDHGVLPAPASRPAADSQPEPEGADPAERLRNLIGERQDETIEILRSWLDPSEEKA